jgi:hypothetical protein
MSDQVGICLITKQHILAREISSIIDYVEHSLHNKEFLHEAAVLAEPDTASYLPADATDSNHVLNSLLVQAADYLSRQKACFHLRLIHFETIDEFFHEIESSTSISSNDNLTLELFILDDSDSAISGSVNGICPEKYFRFIKQCEDFGINIRYSPHSLIVYINWSKFKSQPQLPFGGFHIRLADNDFATHCADFLRILVDHLENTRFNRLLSRMAGTSMNTVTLAEEIKSFMIFHWGSMWDFYSYTGSVISGFIHSMSSENSDTPPQCFTGPNEHSLACGALSSWQLFRRAYVIIITCGMIDEFKGTLSNLQRAEAPGFIICAESPSNLWYAFQGTIKLEGSSLSVAESHKIPYVFIEKTTEIAEKLSEAFRLYSDNPGPVFIFATPQVLESHSSIPPYVSYPKLKTMHASEEIAERGYAAFEEALQIINNSPCHVLWQCGQLGNEERALVYSISERAGIALSDSLTFPGSLSPYHNGHAVPNYLGTLGVYGFNSRVYKFLHTNHELNDKKDQCLFFIKSKIDQAATPFSEGKLARQLWIAQVNYNARHISPFTDVAITMTALQFLKQLSSRLDVRIDVLEKRRNKLDTLLKTPQSMPVDHIANLPMSPNYFFEKLGKLIKGLIEEQGFSYTGVFDVGRGGASAIRNIPRTGPGFSGWYGRAIMGDALAALQYVAFHAPSNVIAFIGDGARAIVPDMETHLVSLLSKEPNIKNKSITVFYLVNGLFSFIQTYFDMRYSQWGGHQMAVPVCLAEARDEHFGFVTVHRANIVEFDNTDICSALSAKGRVNFFNVILSHNSSGDGISLVSESSWNRQSLKEEYE